jgi:hypothetical protein
MATFYLQKTRPERDVTAAPPCGVKEVLYIKPPLLSSPRKERRGALPEKAVQLKSERYGGVDSRIRLPPVSN